jgi:antitoxin component of MazEF toxin-antitoxin module
MDRGGWISIRDLSTAVDLELDDLLSKVTPENIHPESDWGADRGREVLQP